MSIKKKKKKEYERENTYCRNIRTTNERRSSMMAYDEDIKDNRVKIRASRKYNSLPDSWTRDYFPSKMKSKSWKDSGAKLKKQSRNVEDKLVKHTIFVSDKEYSFSYVWRTLQGYFRKNNIKFDVKEVFEKTTVLSPVYKSVECGVKPTGYYTTYHHKDKNGKLLRKYMTFRATGTEPNYRIVKTGEFEEKVISKLVGTNVIYWLNKKQKNPNIKNILQEYDTDYHRVYIPFLK